MKSIGKMKMQSLEQSSLLVKFHVLFVLITIVPLGVLMYLYFQFSQKQYIELTPDQFNNTLIFVAVGVLAGYLSMRVMFNNLVDVTNMTADRLREVLGPDKVQEFLKGDENEIAVLARTFNEITSRLEDNIQNLEMTKKTLQSVLTRVGQGISNLRNIDTFFDLIVETVTEALAGKKGFILLVEPSRNELYVKTVYGMSSKAFDKQFIAIERSPFAPVFIARTALIIPQIQYLHHKDDPSQQDVFDYPIICAPLLLRDQAVGLLAVSGRKNDTSFHEEEMVLLMNLATQTSIAIENSRLNNDADRTYFETLAALAMAVEAKDSYSRGHLDRVGNLSVRIAQHMGMAPLEVGYLRDAAKIHDVGKIGVTDDVLTKPSQLNDQEWAMMKRHPEIGESIIKPITSLQPLCDIVRHHHEKLDGSGYPDGLKDADIKLPVRILAIADIYDALTTNRPYRGAMSHDDAVRVMRDMAGKIDQKVVDALLEIVNKA
ncbi:MAG: HD domain-containing protein [Candidatus Omnitrophica bacterium]|nr:HD domain-containing protein [Candidatus Omnitrophota bacterium]